MRVRVPFAGRYMRNFLHGDILTFATRGVPSRAFRRCIFGSERNPGASS